MRCLDANVWIYFFDDGLTEHDDVVSDVRNLVASEPIFTTTVLQMEVVHYLSTQRSDSTAPIDRFLNLEDVVVADLIAEDVQRATDVLQAHENTGVGGRDATVIAAMDRYDVDQLWTHDGGLKRLGDELDWLDVVDPVES